MVAVTRRHPSAQLIDKHKVLSSHPLFGNFSTSMLERIILRAVARNVKKGTVLFRRGDAGTNLYAVFSGSVRISVPSMQGQDAVFNVIPPGELFGEIALLDGGARTADAVTLENCVLLVIERRDFVPLVRENPDVAMKLIELVCSRLRKTSEQVEDMVFLGLPGRLAKILVRLHSGRVSKANTILITQRDLSQMIGASRESTNKLLREWQRRGWLKLQRGSLDIVAPKVLADLISEHT